MMSNIIQTFWTKPMSFPKVYLYTELAYASAKSIKEQGYNLVMYTDTAGEELLSDFPYDEIKVVDMEDTNPAMFAAIKYKALNLEPLGTIHLDFDILLSKSGISPKPDWKVIVERSLFGDEESSDYKKAQKFLQANGLPSGMKREVFKVSPYCTGAVGFNDENLKSEFLDNYFEAIEMYKNKKIDCTIDLVLEQQYLPYIAKTDIDIVSSGGKFIYPDPRDRRVRYYKDKNIGYIHLHNRSKFTEAGQNEFHKFLDKDDIKIINRNYYRYISK